VEHVRVRRDPQAGLLDRTVAVECVLQDPVAVGQAGDWPAPIRRTFQDSGDGRGIGLSSVVAAASGRATVAGAPVHRRWRCRCSRHPPAYSRGRCLRSDLADPCTVPILGSWPVTWGSRIGSGGSSVLVDDAAEQPCSPCRAAEWDHAGVVIGWVLVEAVVWTVVLEVTLVGS
jgi:hypothetical protein